MDDGESRRVAGDSHRPCDKRFSSQRYRRRGADDDPKYVKLIGYLQYDEVGGVRVVAKLGLGCLWKMQTEKSEGRKLEPRDDGTGSEGTRLLSAAPAAAELSGWGLVFKDGKLRLTAKEKSAAIFHHYRYYNLHPSGK